MSVRSRLARGRCGGAEAAYCCWWCWCSQGSSAGPKTTLALTGDYLDMYETQAWYPEPTEQTRNGEWVFLTFATEGQSEMIIDFDAYVQPNAVLPRSGQLAVVVDNYPVDPISFRTALFP